MGAQGGGGELNGGRKLKGRGELKGGRKLKAGVN